MDSLTKLAAPTAPSAVAAYSDYAGSPRGKPSTESTPAAKGQVSSVIGVASYQHAATVYDAGSRARVRHRGVDEKVE